MMLGLILQPNKHTVIACVLLAYKFFFYFPSKQQFSFPDCNEKMGWQQLATMCHMACQTDGVSFSQLSSVCSPVCVTCFFLSWLVLTVINTDGEIPYSLEPHTFSM
jgi:hypothetical protein